MTKTRISALAVLVPLTAAAYAVLLWITAFVACGISGCSGGGFGTAFSPGQAQVGLLVCGAVLAPLALLLLHRQPRRTQLLGTLVLTVSGTVLAMGLTQLGPNGCPLGQGRATAGPDAFTPGASTCDSDDDALRPR